MSQDQQQDKLLRTPAPQFSEAEIIKIAKELYGLNGTLSLLGSERDQNFHLITGMGDQYVIKIANSAEDRGIIDFQLKALEHISRVDPGLPVPKVTLSKSGNIIEEVKASDGRKHQVRVVSYLPGIYPKDEYVSEALYRQMGKYLARLGKALRGFFHPNANYELLWDLKHSSKLRDYLGYISDPDHQEQASYFLDRFDKNVQPQISKLRSQIVHNDLVPDNILVSEDDHAQIVGIIDFGDLSSRGG